MTDLLNVDFQLISGFENNEYILIRTGSCQYNLNEDETIGLINQLSIILSELSNQLTINVIKKNRNVINNDIEKRVADAYIAGWENSGEGYNAEYGTSKKEDEDNISRYMKGYRCRY